VHVKASPLLLYTEVAEDGCLGHIPALPGFSLRAANPDLLPTVLLPRIDHYAGWLLAHKLTDVSPQATEVALARQADRLRELQIVEAERIAGAPVWLSGSPATLFASDRQPLSDADVQGHLRFALCAVEQMRLAVGGLAPEARQARPAPDRRSLDETLSHVGNCIWWYCSRIDDDLPEPIEIEGEDFLDRVARLAQDAAVYLASVPFAARGRIHVPHRFPTRDADEPWTHTKACRRQAEHLWDHLPGVRRAGGQET